MLAKKAKISGGSMQKAINVLEKYLQTTVELSSSTKYSPMRPSLSYEQIPTSNTISFQNCPILWFLGPIISNYDAKKFCLVIVFTVQYFYETKFETSVNIYKMTHSKECKNSSIQLTLLYFIRDHYIIYVSDDEEDEWYIELDNNSTLIMSSHHKLSLLRKKRLLRLSKKGKITKHSNTKTQRFWDGC